MPYDPRLSERIISILEQKCAFEEKKMFGGVAYMVNGKMCCGVVNTDLVLRLGQDAATAALVRPHTRPMDFTGKPMKSMIYVAAAGTKTDRDLEKWLLLALRSSETSAPPEL